MAPSPDSTAFVLVPGGFCPGSYFDKVTAKLKGMGYAVTPIDNPTMGDPTKPPATFYDDSAAVRAAAAGYMDEGKDVIVAATSYGGFVATEAMKELSEAERKATGKSGGRLSNLVYWGSFVPHVGVTMTELMGGEVDDVVQISDKPFSDPPPPEISHVVLLNDVSAEEALDYGKRCRTQSSAAFHGKLTHEGYLHVPVTWLIPENDKCVDPEKQSEQVDALVASGKGRVKKMMVASDHCMMISHPDELIKILLESP